MIKIPRNLRCFVCIHVFEQTHPANLVAHEEDGAWSFNCGDVHPDSAEYYRSVGLGHLLDADSTLKAILDLPPGWEAERFSPGGPWMKTALTPN